MYTYRGDLVLVLICMLLSLASMAHQVTLLSLYIRFTGIDGSELALSDANSSCFAYRAWQVAPPLSKCCNCFIEKGHPSRSCYSPLAKIRQVARVCYIP